MQKLSAEQQAILRELPKRLPDNPQLQELLELGLVAKRATPVPWDTDFYERTDTGDRLLAESVKELVKELVKEPVKEPVK